MNATIEGIAKAMYEKSLDTTIGALIRYHPSWDDMHRFDKTEWCWLATAAIEYLLDNVSEEISDAPCDCCQELRAAYVWQGKRLCVGCHNFWTAALNAALDNK